MFDITTHFMLSKVFEMEEKISQKITKKSTKDKEDG